MMYFIHIIQNLVHFIGYLKIKGYSAIETILYQRKIQ